MTYWEKNNLLMPDVDGQDCLSLQLFLLMAMCLWWMCVRLTGHVVLQ